MDAELFGRSRADRVIRALGERSPMTMREFTEASRHTPRLAKTLLDHLVELNLVRVTRRPGFGNVGFFEIRLSAWGEKVYGHLVSIQHIVDEAQASKTDAPPS